MLLKSVAEALAAHLAEARSDAHGAFKLGTIYFGTVRVTQEDVVAALQRSFLHESAHSAPAPRSAVPIGADALAVELLIASIQNVKSEYVALSKATKRLPSRAKNEHLSGVLRSLVRKRDAIASLLLKHGVTTSDYARARSKLLDLWHSQGAVPMPSLDGESDLPLANEAGASEADSLDSQPPRVVWDYQPTQHVALRYHSDDLSTGAPAPHRQDAAVPAGQPLPEQHADRGGSGASRLLDGATGVSVPLFEALPSDHEALDVSFESALKMILNTTSDADVSHGTTTAADPAGHHHGQHGSDNHHRHNAEQQQRLASSFSEAIQHELSDHARASGLPPSSSALSSSIQVGLFAQAAARQVAAAKRDLRAAATRVLTEVGRRYQSAVRQAVIEAQTRTAADVHAAWASRLEADVRSTVDEAVHEERCRWEGVLAEERRASQSRVQAAVADATARLEDDVAHRIAQALASQAASFNAQRSKEVSDTNAAFQTRLASAVDRAREDATAEVTAAASHAHAKAMETLRREAVDERDAAVATAAQAARQESELVHAAALLAMHTKHQQDLDDAVATATAALAQHAQQEADLTAQLQGVVARAEAAVETRAAALVADARIEWEAAAAEDRSRIDAELAARLQSAVASARTEGEARGRAYMAGTVERSHAEGRATGRAEATGQVKAITAELAAARIECDSLRDEITRLVDQVSSLTFQLDEAKAHAAGEAGRTAAAVDAACVDVTSRLALRHQQDLLAQEAAHESTLQELRSELEVHRRHSQELEASRTQLQSSVDELQSQLGAAVQLHDGAQAQLRQLADDLQSSEAARVLAERTVASLSQELVTARASAEASNAIVEAGKALQDTLQRQLNASVAAIDSLRSDLSDAAIRRDEISGRLSASDSALSERQSTIAGLEELVTALRQRLDAAESEAAVLRAQHGQSVTMQQEMCQLRDRHADEVAGLRQQLAVLEDVASSTRTALEGRILDLERERDEAAAALHLHQQTHAALVESLRQDIAAAGQRAEVAELAAVAATAESKRQKEERDRQVAALQQEHSAWQATMRAQHDAVVQQMKDDREDDRRVAAALASELTAQLDVLQSRAAQLQEAHAETEQQKSEVESELSSLRTKQASDAEAAHALQQHTLALNDEVHHLKSVVADKESRISVLEAELGLLRDRVSQLQAPPTHEPEAVDMAAQLLSAANEIARLTSDLDLSHHMGAQLAEELGLARTQAAQANDACAAVQGRLSSCQVEVDTVTRALRASRQEVIALRERLEDAIGELQLAEGRVREADEAVAARAAAAAAAPPPTISAASQSDITGDVLAAAAATRAVDDAKADMRELLSATRADLHRDRQALQLSQDDCHRLTDEVARLKAVAAGEVEARHRVEEQLQASASSRRLRDKQHDARVEQLRKALADETSKAAAAIDRASHLEGAAKASAAQVDQLSARIASLQARCTELADRLSEAHDERSDLRARLEEWRADAKASEAARQAAAGEAAQHLAKLQQLQVQVAGAEARAASSDEDVMRVEASLAQAMARHRSEADAAVASSVAAEAAAWETAIRNCMTEMEQHAAALLALQKRYGVAGSSDGVADDDDTADEVEADVAAAFTTILADCLAEARSSAPTSSSAATPTRVETGLSLLVKRAVGSLVDAVCSHYSGQVTRMGARVEAAVAAGEARGREAGRAEGRRQVAAEAARAEATAGHDVATRLAAADADWQRRCDDAEAAATARAEGEIASLQSQVAASRAHAAEATAAMAGLHDELARADRRADDAEGRLAAQMQACKELQGKVAHLQLQLLQQQQQQALRTSLPSIDGDGSAAPRLIRKVLGHPSTAGGLSSSTAMMSDEPIPNRSDGNDTNAANMWLSSTMMPGEGTATVVGASKTPVWKRSHDGDDADEGVRGGGAGDADSQYPAFSRRNDSIMRQSTSSTASGVASLLNPNRSTIDHGAPAEGLFTPHRGVSHAASKPAAAAAGQEVPSSGADVRLAADLAAAVAERDRLLSCAADEIGLLYDRLYEAVATIDQLQRGVADQSRLEGLSLVPADVLDQSLRSIAAARQHLGRTALTSSSSSSNTVLTSLDSSRMPLSSPSSASSNPGLLVSLVASLEASLAQVSEEAMATAGVPTDFGDDAGSSNDRAYVSLVSLDITTAGDGAIRTALSQALLRMQTRTTRIASAVRSLSHAVVDGRERARGREYLLSSLQREVATYQAMLRQARVTTNQATQHHAVATLNHVGVGAAKT